MNGYSSARGRIAVLVEAHFDETEYRRFNEFFPEHGYAVDYASHLWNQPSLTFKGNDMTAEVTVDIEVESLDLGDYQGLILIGGYAMDRLRYQEHLRQGQPNRAPAVELLRRAVAEMDAGRLQIGTICHSMWLFCAAPELVRGRRVTCAHNILCDVQAAGADVVFDGDQAAETVVDRGLVSARHPGVVDQFLKVYLEELGKAKPAPRPAVAAPAASEA
jgi:putative intracellular protease/amidase